MSHHIHGFTSSLSSLFLSFLFMFCCWVPSLSGPVRSGSGFYSGSVDFFPLPLSALPRAQLRFSSTHSELTCSLMDADFH